MRALFDVSMLIAAFDAGHIFHDKAIGWWLDNRENGWASSTLTENCFLRIVTQRSYPRPVLLPDALATLRKQIAEPGHAFWPDDFSVLDPAMIDHRFLLGPGQLTDIYLLGLAVRNGGRLVTFDTAIRVAAVKGASAEHLVAI